MNSFLKAVGWRNLACVWFFLLLFGPLRPVCFGGTGIGEAIFPVGGGIGGVEYLVVAQTDELDDDFGFEFDDDEDVFWVPLAGPVADPLEPLNRVFFQFNDKLYYWALKPVATVYSRMVAKDIRLCLRNSFYNILTPVRIVNNLLQGKLKNSWIELSRFLVNTTMGAAGLGDAAKELGLAAPDEEDLGQTLGVYGLGEGVYICWPIFGPSTLRDTFGKVGDSFLDPLTYVAGGWTGAVALQGGRRVNEISFAPGDYELFTKTALDPYSTVRNAYLQYRRGKIRGANFKKSGIESLARLSVKKDRCGLKPVSGDLSVERKPFSRIIVRDIVKVDRPAPSLGEILALESGRTARVRKRESRLFVSGMVVKET